MQPKSLMYSPPELIRFVVQCPYSTICIQIQLPNTHNLHSGQLFLLDERKWVGKQGGNVPREKIKAKLFFGLLSLFYVKKKRFRPYIPFCLHYKSWEFIFGPEKANYVFFGGKQILWENLGKLGTGPPLACILFITVRYVLHKSIIQHTTLVKQSLFLGLIIFILLAII